MRLLPRLKLNVGALLIAVAAFALGIWAEKSRVRYEMLMGHAEACRAMAEHNRANVRIIESWLKEYRETGQQCALMQLYTSKNGLEGLDIVLELSRSTAERAERLHSRCLWAAFLPVQSMPAELFQKGLAGFDLIPSSTPPNTGPDNLAFPVLGD